jgi:queuine/archaeosine tRNA-ribosyltransferase
MYHTFISTFDAHNTLRRKCLEDPKPSTLNPQPSTPNPHSETTGFDGYAVGGMSVGEPEEKMLAMMSKIIPKVMKPCNLNHLS